MNSDLIYYWLSQIDGLTSLRQKKLSLNFGSDLEIYNNWKNGKHFIISVIGEKGYESGGQALKSVEKDFLELEKQKIGIITKADALFPINLINMPYDCPNVLYYAGNKEVFKTKCFGIVGTRNCSEYGIRTAKKFSAALTQKGFTIVSGLALGIDTAAHTACLDAGGKTIAFLGSGIKKLTPVENLNLAKKIAQDGLIVSDFPPLTQGAKFTYPQRNRLISGMSDGVLIVEADDESGALYTVNHAIEQNKPVYCIPGRADSKKSEGVHNIIRACQGMLVYEPKHIFEDLKIDGEINDSNENFKKLKMFSFAEQKVLDILDNCELNYDSLFERAGLSHQELSNALFGLEMKDEIGTEGNDYFRKK